VEGTKGFEMGFWRGIKSGSERRTSATIERWGRGRD